MRRRAGLLTARLEYAARLGAVETAIAACERRLQGLRRRACELEARIDRIDGLLHPQTSEAVLVLPTSRWRR